MEVPVQGDDAERKAIAEGGNERNQVQEETCEQHNVTVSESKIGARRSLLYLILVAIVIGSLLLLVAVNVLWRNWRPVNEPLHSTVEALGALAALIMVVFLFERKSEEYGQALFLIAIGFLGMGLLDGFHAVSSPGHGFVLLHSVASLVGGFWFVMVWLPRSAPDRYVALKKSIPLFVVAASILFGAWTLLAKEALPAMLRDGEFTTTAVAINLLAGVFFVLGAGRFLIDFRRSNRLEIYLFTCMALLFGVAELVFPYSQAWGVSWWLWHLLRVIAYLLVLGYVVHEYRRTISGFRVEISQRRLAEEALRTSRDELETRVEELQERDEMIRKLSTPLLEAWEGIVVQPLIGVLDSARAKQITESILNRIAQTKTKIIVMDVSGIAAVDTKAASHILSTVRAVRLMGSDVVITGIRPDVATTLVTLGVDLSDIATRSTLGEGIKYAYAKLGLKITKS